MKYIPESAVREHSARAFGGFQGWFPQALMADAIEGVVVPADAARLLVENDHTKSRRGECATCEARRLLRDAIEAS